MTARRNMQLLSFVGLVGILSIAQIEAFGLPGAPRVAFASTAGALSSPTALFAKKKKSPAAAALEKLGGLDVLDDDAPLSKKEMKALAKKQHKVQKKAQGDDADDEPAAAAPAPQAEKAMSKKEQMLAKTLEMEALDEAAANVSSDEPETPKLSKKELKELKKKEEKQREKDEKKRQKKEAAQEAREPVEAAAENDAPRKKRNMSMVTPLPRTGKPSKILAPRWKTRYAKTDPRRGFVSWNHLSQDTRVSASRVSE